MILNSISSVTNKTNKHRPGQNILFVCFGRISIFSVLDKERLDLYYQYRISISFRMFLEKPLKQVKVHGKGLRLCGQENMVQWKRPSIHCMTKCPIM